MPTEYLSRYLTHKKMIFFCQGQITKYLLYFFIVQSFQLRIINKLQGRHAMRGTTGKTAALHGLSENNVAAAVVARQWCGRHCGGLACQISTVAALSCIATKKYKNQPGTYKCNHSALWREQGGSAQLFRSFLKGNR